MEQNIEHLLPGNLGHFFIILSFVASLLATTAFAVSTQLKFELNISKKFLIVTGAIGALTFTRFFGSFTHWTADLFFSATSVSLIISIISSIVFYLKQNSSIHHTESWLRFARAAFLLQVFSILAVFVILYFIIYNHYHEYFYAWNHSSRDLEMKYIFSCFWEGSEGSFLLWSFWHCVLGVIILFRKNQWEAPVMSVISFAQMCLALMVIGIYFGTQKIGSNPFILLKEQFPELSADANYLSIDKIRQGNGLNTLLQNYWMTIHPPVLFLGFASTIVPFAYAIAGLWTKKFSDIIKPVMPWALFNSAILGLGIMMGAAWAYEALSFGGYWAWDPVENASLVPWMVGICGFHTAMAYKHTGHSLRSTYFFFIVSFILILYSTYLTRSGVLGDSSVHAFTDLGMNFQLKTFVFIFTIPSLILFFKKYCQIPVIAKEELFSSREFWLFIGSILFFIGAIYISFFTSLPLFNEVLTLFSEQSKLAIGENQEFTYNRVMILIIIIIAILTAFAQFLKFKQTDGKFFLKKIAPSLIISLIVSALISIYGNISYSKMGAGLMIGIHAAMFAAVFSMVGNAQYIITGIKGKLSKAGASIAHIGFGMLLAGILLSSAKKAILSYNTTEFSPLSLTDKENGLENITLVKGVTTDMGKYLTTYKGASTTKDGKHHVYELHFKEKKSNEEFTLFPNLVANTKGQEGLSPNPDSKHYLFKDIFAYITSSTRLNSNAGAEMIFERVAKPGDTIPYKDGKIIFNRLKNNTQRIFIPTKSGDSILSAELSILGNDNGRSFEEPVFIKRNTDTQSVSDTSLVADLVISIKSIEGNQVKFEIKRTSIDYITLKVLEFPFINLVWFGTIIMIAGFIIAIIKRIKKIFEERNIEANL